MPLRRFAKILAALVAFAAIALAALAFIDIEVDAQRWREPVAAALARAIGREVRLDGPARLTLSLHPAIVVGDLHIANPPGFDAPDFARIGELRLALALLPLLRDELRVDEVRGRDVAVRLARESDGGGNWRFAPRAAADSRTRLRLDIHRVALKNVLIEYATGSTVRRFALAELAGEARADEPVRLMFRGTVDDRVAYTVDATGAPVAAFGGADPWPFDFRLAFPGTVVNGMGTMSGPLEGPAVRVTVGAGTKDLREVGTILELGLPAIGAALAAQFDLESGTARLGAINGVVGANAVSGELTLDTGGPRPKLSGRLTVPELDVRPFLARVPLGAAEEPATLAGAFRELEHVGFDPRQLASVDADVQVAVGHFAGPPGDPRDINANVRIDAGRLAAPLAATIAGARFEGDLAVDGTTTPPRMRAQLLARDAPLGRIAELLFDAPHVAGTVRRFEVRLDATGENIAALARDLEARIGIEDARLTYGNFAGGRPVAMRLDAAELRQPRGKTITARLRGSLRGKSFDGTFRAGTVERILRERRTPFGFDGASGSVRARLSGTLAEPTATTGPEVAFDVAAPRARELTPWLGLSSESDTRVALKGTVRVTRRSASLTGGSLRIGRTSITGDVTSQAVGAKPLVRANLVAELLAPAELRTLATPPGTARRATLLEIPILPESLDFADSDMEVRVKRVDGLPLEITDIVFQGRMRAGEIAPSPFSLRVERNALAGALGLDARDDAPTASLWLAGDDFDVGPLLRRLRVARDIESRIGTVRFYAEIRERRLGDVLDQSSFVASIESGTLDVRDANSRAALRIGVDAGEVRANAGAPVTAAITGTIGTTPVALKAQAGRLREIVEADRRLPFSLAAETPAAKLAISGTAAPPRNPDVALALALTGARLDGLDTLLGTSLPPWGPYALTARLRFPKRGYDVEAIRLTLGESVLEGKGSLDTTLAPPKLDVVLAAERIQLDDFPLGEWSPFGERDFPADPMTVETTRRAVAASARRAHAIFSRERLGTADGNFDLVVKRVVAGKYELGSGRFASRVANGRATIGPVEVESRAGSARGSLVYEPRERDVLVDARVNVDRFDYGVLARYVRPGSDLDGAFGLDLRLAATAPRLSAALASGSGRFDFAVWPERLQGGVFDLWTANMLFRLLPIIDVSASPMNCLVGQFDLEHGKLESVRIVIDTVNTRTEGSGRADFATDEIHLRFVPRPKVPQFFSFAPPIEVNGKFEDYRFGVRPSDAFATAVRWVASPVVVPIHRLVGERIPADGRDVCANPGR